jgi:hypothetical protein
MVRRGLATTPPVPRGIRRLYFLRKIVRPGGLIVLDDHWWPSVRTAAHYFEVNMGWRVVPGAFDGGTIDQETGRTRAQALRLPNPPFEPA